MARLGNNTASIMAAASMYRPDEQTDEDGCCSHCGEWNAQLDHQGFCRRKDDEECWQARLAIALTQGDRLLRLVSAGKDAKKVMGTMNTTIGFAQMTSEGIVWI